MRRVKKRLKWMILGGVLVATPTLARQDLVPGSRYTSGRAAAMGEAFLPLAEDAPSALFYNPAGLASIRRPMVEPFNLNLMANSSFVNSFGTQSYNITSLSSSKTLLNSNRGAFPGVGFGYMPSFAVPGLAFGVLAQSWVAGQEQFDGNIRYRSLYQIIPTVGGALNLAKGIVKIGYSLQWVNQSSGDLVVPSTTDPLGYNQGLQTGSAFSHNLGYTLTFPFRYLPTFSIVARNVLGTHYKSNSLTNVFAKNSVGTPEDENMSVDASFSIHPKTGQGGNLNLVFEGRDITNQSGMSLLGRVAVGMELAFRDVLQLRAGIRSGYPSAGIGLGRDKAKFSLTWYSEEVGTSYHQERESRFMMHYQIRAF